MSCVIDQPDVGVVTEPADGRARQVFAALEFLAAAQIESMNRADLDAVVKARRDVVSFADAVEVRIARRSRQLAAEGRSEPAGDVLRERGKRSAREAAAAAGREQACEQLPAFEPALADGEVSSGHLDALANTTGKLGDTAKAEFVKHEADLLANARTTSVEAFERHCRDLARQITADDAASELERQRAANRVRHWIDKLTGMGHIHTELDPESHAKVLAAINIRLRTLHRQQRPATGPATAPATAPAGDDPASAAMAYDQMEAQAFIDLVTGSSTLDRRTPEVIVLIDLHTLINGLRDESLCETSDGIALPPATARRLCCEAIIIPAVLDSAGEPLDLGRGKRLASPAQRRAILAMYRTCGFPGCTVSVDHCEVHHTEEWLAHHGPTSVDKLVPLCCQHHHLIHEGGWRLTLSEHRQATVHRPDGIRYFAGNTTNRRRPPDGSGRVSACHEQSPSYSPSSLIACTTS